MAIMWIDRILHHSETMGNHCLLVSTGETSETRVLRWCEMDFVHQQYGERGIHRERSESLRLSARQSGCEERPNR